MLKDGRGVILDWSTYTSHKLQCSCVQLWIGPQYYRFSHRPATEL